ncbi:MAG: aminopeptidase P family N-terminal domain-containing protein, partial [Candidatus Puniceispirillaceae bacterium]
MTQLNEADTKLGTFRHVLKSMDLDGFYLTRADRFQGEEVREEDEYLAYLTGFTGSAGIGLILDRTAGLFTDGRYRLQIAQQTDASLYQSFDSGDKTLAQWMAEQVATGQVRLGYDSWSVTEGVLEKLPVQLGQAQISWVGCETNPLNEVWQNRPQSDSTDIFILDEDITGQSASQKQAEAAEDLHQEGCRFSLITAPDCVNWLANIRGRDLHYTPFHLCFGLLRDDGDL